MARRFTKEISAPAGAPSSPSCCVDIDAHRPPSLECSPHRTLAQPEAVEDGDGEVAAGKQLIHDSSRLTAKHPALRGYLARDATSSLNAHALRLREVVGEQHLEGKRCTDRREPKPLWRVGGDSDNLNPCVPLAAEHNAELNRAERARLSPEGDEDIARRDPSVLVYAPKIRREG
jgi:hypothetical protein